ncbi:hypothetical protein IWQ60_010723 [Tieghemiomyces parasiticus]|uniref:Amino acid permease/ SLC12A domain-containing protein n=1 Tax=Tieghemiomyces parasiticus TaxID=78921 RepID=A0A9W8DN62_9FUNG|nr:hypothetical protein IWQ60_010723 [Tieghemiomyces parasiticus]
MTNPFAAREGVRAPPSWLSTLTARFRGAAAYHKLTDPVTATGDVGEDGRPLSPLANISPAGAPVSESTELPRTMGVVSGSALVCGLMIGSGIFSTPGVVLTMTGSAWMAMVYWLLGAFVAMCGALTYVELGALLPESGGEQVYLDYCIRKPRQLFGFLFSFCMIACMRPGSIATNAIVFSRYLGYALYGPETTAGLAIMTTAHLDTEPGTLEPPVVLPVPADQRHLYLLAMACLVIITAINAVSVKWSLRALDLLTWIKVFVLGLVSITGLIILTGLTNVPRSDLWARGFAGTTPKLHRHSSAIFSAFWAFDGWHNLNFCLGELKNPARNLPICAVGGIAVTTVLYVFTNVALFTVLTLDDVLAGQEVLTGTWGTIVFGPFFGRVIIPLAVAVSCAGSISAMVFGVSRIIVAAGNKGYLPYGRFWARIQPRTGTPVNALLLNLVLVSLYILGPPPGEAFRFLVDFVGYPSRLFYGFTVFGFILLRRLEPDLPRPFSVWLPLPWIFIVVTIFLAIFPFVPPSDGHIIEPNGLPYFFAPLLGALYVWLGTPFWYYLVRRRQQPALHAVSSAAS